MADKPAACLVHRRTIDLAGSIGVSLKLAWTSWRQLVICQRRSTECSFFVMSCGSSIEDVSTVERSLDSKRADNERSERPVGRLSTSRHCLVGLFPSFCSGTVFLTSQSSCREITCEQYYWLLMSDSSRPELHFPGIFDWLNPLCAGCVVVAVPHFLVDQICE